MNDLGPFGFIAVALLLTVCVASCDSRLAYSESIHSDTYPTTHHETHPADRVGRLAAGLDGRHVGATKPPSPLTHLDPATVLRDAADLVLLAVSQSWHVERRVQGLVGNTTVTGDIRATVWIGTDLTQARVIVMDADTRTLELELQLPGLMQVSIDPQASRITAERNGLWVLALDSTHEASLTQQLFAEAQQEISEQPIESQLAKRAEFHAHTVLQQLFDTGGWTVELRGRGP